MEWPKTAKNGQKRPEMAKVDLSRKGDKAWSGQKWPKVAKSGQKRPKYFSAYFLVVKWRAFTSLPPPLGRSFSPLTRLLMAWLQFYNPYFDPF